MPSTQEMLSFYRDWDRDLFDQEVRDAAGWKRLSGAPFHQQAPPRRILARNGKHFAVASTVR